MSTDLLTLEPPCEHTPTALDFSSIYTLIRHLGEGGCGKVWLVEHKTNKTLHVVKMINDIKCYRKTWCEERQMMIPDEIILWKPLSHPNLLNLEDTYLENDTWFILMEYVPGFIDLFDYIDRRGPVNTNAVRYILSQILNTIYYLMSQDIDHRDIKDENILFNPTTRQIKLIDFGSASLIIPDTHYTIFQGTDVYMPPEFYHTGKYNPLSGMTWTVGCLVYVLLNGDKPFPSKDHVIRYKTLNYLNKNLDKESKCFLEDLLMLDVNKRYNIIDLINHPWMSI